MCAGSAWVSRGKRRKEGETDLFSSEVKEFALDSTKFFECGLLDHLVGSSASAFVDDVETGRVRPRLEEVGSKRILSPQSAQRVLVSL